MSNARIGYGRALLLLLALTACGGGNSDKPGGPTENGPPPEVSVSMSPASATVSVGGSTSFTATVSGTDTKTVQWTASAGTIVPSGNSATWTAPVASGSYKVTATSTADPSRSASATITVPQIGLTVSPSSSTVGFGGSQTLTASITGIVDNSLTWTASGGTIDGSGATVTWQSPESAGDYTIVVRSVASPGTEASAEVTVTPIQVALTEETLELRRGEVRTIHAEITGAAEGFRGVKWEASCGTGAPDTEDESAFEYTAPSSGGPCTITATSKADGTQSASLAVTLRPEVVVNTLDDTDDGACTPTHCSLREALALAASEPDTLLIILEGSNGSLRSGVRSGRVNRDAGGATIHLTDSLPRITTVVAIIGPGSGNFTIAVDGTNEARRRAFIVDDSARLSLRGVSITGGLQNFGGAIAVTRYSSLTLDDVRLSQNMASAGPGGAVYISSGSQAFLSDVVFDGNSSSGASGDGGAVYLTGSDVNIINGTLTNNSETGTGGGAISGYNSGITLDSVTVSGNATAQQGGGIKVAGKGHLVITHSVIEGNSATGPGGGIAVTVYLLGGYTDIYTGTIEMDDVIIRNNTTRSQGGGIQMRGNAVVSMNRVRLIGNRVLNSGLSSQFPIAGGMLIGSKSIVSITNSTFSGNEIETNLYASSNGGGGGILITDPDGYPVSVTIRNSTVSGNKSAFLAGGIHSMKSDVLIENSTISGNTATSGGAIVNGANLTLINTTIVGNRADNRWGGVRNASNLAWPSIPSLNITNTILSDNISKDGEENCIHDAGTMISHGGNISGDYSCDLLNHSSDRAGVVPGLNTQLADNGGPTFTHALLAGSIAIDAGIEDKCPPADQRGMPRVGRCDIGAFEFVPAGNSFRSLTTPARSMSIIRHGLPQLRAPREVIPVPAGGLTQAIQPPQIQK